jgi:hypothetical protein
MTDDPRLRVLLLPHEESLDTGSFEVRYPDGGASEYFYFENSPDRRTRFQVMTRAEALKVAQAKARQAQEALDQTTE